MITRQDVVDMVCDYYGGGEKPGYNFDKDQCAYVSYDDDGTVCRCAVGALLHRLGVDDSVLCEMNNLSNLDAVLSDHNVRPKLKDVEEDVTNISGNNRGFLLSMQGAHDYAAMSCLEEENSGERMKVVIKNWWQAYRVNKVMPEIFGYEAARAVAYKTGLEEE